MEKNLPQEQIDFLNKGTFRSAEYVNHPYYNTYGDWKYNYETGLVDITGNFYIGGRYNEVIKFPSGLRFGSVTGNFYISYSDITSLEGFPQFVANKFDVSNNRFLESLEGGPQEVGGDYQCVYCELTSLRGIARIIGGSIYANSNKLESLEGIEHLLGNNITFFQNRGISDIILTKCLDLMKEGLSWEDSLRTVNERVKTDRKDNKTIFLFMPDNHYGFPEYVDFSERGFTIPNPDEIFIKWKSAGYSWMDDDDDNDERPTEDDFNEYGNCDLYSKLFIADGSIDKMEFGRITDIVGNSYGDGVSGFRRIKDNMIKSALEELGINIYEVNDSEALGMVPDKSLIKTYCSTSPGEMDYIKDELEKRGIYDSKFESIRRMVKRKKITT
jgi:hypothetical protein